ncbi:MAG: hypothetical protein K2Z81_07195, partial [Cyanobacteria bacterium]|nr:hypothetical protein [Cyanobacteriota bacterium]
GWDAKGKPVLMGEIIARGSAVCLDQAVLVKYLADSMNAGGVRVQTGSYATGDHAWVTFGDGNRSLVFDPRNHDVLTNLQRKGIPSLQSRDYKTFSTNHPRFEGKIRTSVPISESDAVTALKSAPFDEAYLLATSVESGSITPTLREAVRDRLIRELNNPKSSAQLSELTDLSAILSETEKSPSLRTAVKERFLNELKQATGATHRELCEFARFLGTAERTPEVNEQVRTYTEETIASSATPWEVAGLAEEFGISAQQAARMRVERELADPSAKLAPKDLVKLAREFDIFKDESVKRAILPKLVDEAVAGGDNILKVRLLLEGPHGLGRDPVFRDQLADGLARRVRLATPEAITEVETLIGALPELKVSEQPKLVIDSKTTAFLEELRTATSGTEVGPQVESTLSEPDILSNNARLSDLYSALKRSSNKRVRDFLEKHPSKEAVINAWKEQLRADEFSRLIREPELNLILDGRPLEIDGALTKFKQLLKNNGFPESGDNQIAELKDDVLRNHLRQRARVKALQEAIYEQARLALESQNRTDQWRSLAEAAQEHRATNAIDYMNQN